MWGESDVVILYRSCSQFSGILWRPREQGRKCFIPISKRSLCNLVPWLPEKSPHMDSYSMWREQCSDDCYFTACLFRGRVNLTFIFSYRVFTPNCGTNKGDLISSNAWQRAGLKAAVFYFLKASVSLVVKWSLSPTLPLCGSPMTWWNFRG